jgi:non-heme chloroperoxidase
MRKKMVPVFSVIMLASLALSAPAKEKPQYKDTFVSVGDIKIHYIDAGSGDRTIVFIPGWTMTAEVWKEQIPYFTSRGFRVIAFDPRSQGLTTKTESGNTYQQQAADLHAFLNVLKADHSYLVAWNSAVNMLLEYITSPETYKPEMMVFAGGGPALLKEGDYPGLMTMQQVRKLWLSFQDDRAKATEQIVRGMFKEKQLESIYTELKEASLKTPMGAALSLLLDSVTGDRRPALRHVAVPTLILTTSENQAVGEYMKSKAPRSRLEVIEGAGDAMFLDKPQTFNQLLESFFGEH